MLNGLRLRVRMPSDFVVFTSGRKPNLVRKICNETIGPNIRSGISQENRQAMTDLWWYRSRRQNLQGRGIGEGTRRDTRTKTKR